MAPKIVAVANTKGGVGKTTVALQLAVARARQGKDVWLVDGDRQQTASMALTLRDTQPVDVFVNCASYSNGTLLGKQVQGQADKWDTIIIDVGGFDSTTMRMALAVSDVLIVPFQPRTFDTWALSQMSALIDEVVVLRNNVPLPAYAIINAADTNKSSDNQEAAEALSDYPNIQLLDCPLGRRKAYANASGLGLGVSEVKTKDLKAIGEVNRLVAAIFGNDASNKAPKEKKDVSSSPASKSEGRKPTARKTATKKKGATE